MIENDEISQFREKFIRMINSQDNPFHPLVFINGTPKIGENTYIGPFSEVNANGAEVIIGKNCDIASFVSINVADSHKKCIGLMKIIEKKSIHIEDCVFIGSHSFVKGGAFIGNHSVISAGTIVEGVAIPPFSLVYGNPMKVKARYYNKKG